MVKKIFSVYSFLGWFNFEIIDIVFDILMFS